MLNNDGLDRIEISSPFALFGEDEGIDGRVRNIARFNNNIFIATTDKVFVGSNNHAQNGVFFQSMGGLHNVWSFLPLKNRLLAASSNGVYEIINTKARLLSLGQKKTFTLFRSRIDSTKIYCGTSGGLALLEFRAGQWQYQGLIKGVKDEVRYIEEFPAGQLWLGTYNRGIIKASLKTDSLDVEYFGLDDGLETLKLYIPIVLKGKLFFNSAPSSVLYYDTGKNRFFKEPQFLDAAQKVSKLVEDAQGNILFKRIVDDGARIVLGTYKNQSYSFSEKPFLRIKNINPITIFPDKNGITWFGYKNGLLRYDSNNMKRDSTIAPTLIRKVKFQDSLVYRGMNLENNSRNRFNFPYQNNTVRFEFAFAGFDAPDQNAYQYFLDGYERSWSDWTHESQKD
jgi:ligand-binding sensor domain-containing protein